MTTSSILSSQTIPLSALTQSVLNSNTDYVLSATPDVYSSTGYVNTKAKIVSVPTSSYSLTASYISGSIVGSPVVNADDGHTYRLRIISGQLDWSEQIS